METKNIQRFENVENPGIRQRIYHEVGETKAYLDGLIQRILSHRGVEHPFLHYYAKNPLTKEQECKLFLESFYFFQYLPFYIAGMSMLTRDENVFRELLSNALDEVGDSITHSMLYRQFLHKLGISDESIGAYLPLESTTALNQGIKKLYTETDIVTALGALYADETMSATMTAKLNDGLKNQGYDEDVRYFWILHTEVEVGHSNSVFNAIFPYLQEEKTKQRFEAGLAEFLALLEAYWDGVDALTRGEQSTMSRSV